MATATHYGNLVNYLVLPSENDHYGSGYGGVGAGLIPTELTMGPLVQAYGHTNGYVISGFALPSTGGSLSGGKVSGVNVTAGSAVINGHYIVGTSTIAVSFTPSGTSYCWLQLEVDANSKAVRPVVYIDDAGYTTPSATNAIFLGAVTVGASSITSAKDARWQGQVVIGTMYVDGSVNPDYTNAATLFGSGNWTASKVSSTLRITYNRPYLRAPYLLDSSSYSVVSIGATYTDFTPSGAGGFFFHFMG